jgi:hypothetical protein
MIFDLRNPINHLLRMVETWNILKAIQNPWGFVPEKLAFRICSSISGPNTKTGHPIPMVSTGFNGR